ncbi:MAG TPA: thioredoxin domain-containing protein [Bryobacteraceae bacterium]|jgi:thioredoxin 1
MSDSGTITLTDATFETEVLESKIPVLVDFWAQGCGGCRQIAPVLELLASEYLSRAKVGKLDAILNSQTAIRYQVRRLPTLLLFKGGAVVAQSVGVIGMADLHKMLSQHI